MAEADWDDDFPMYRSTDSGLWHNYVHDLRDTAEAPRRKEPAGAVRRVLGEKKFESSTHPR